MRVRPSLSLALVALCLSAASTAAAPLRVTLGATGVSVSGVTAKGRAVVFGITREVAGDDVTTIQPHLDVLSDDDGDGLVSEDLGKPMPRRSMWVAVDLASGDFAAAAPPAFCLPSPGGGAGGRRERGRG